MIRSLALALLTACTYDATVGRTSALENPDGGVTAINAPTGSRHDRERRSPDPRRRGHDLHDDVL